MVFKSTYRLQVIIKVYNEILTTLRIFKNFRINSYINSKQTVLSYIWFKFHLNFLIFESAQ